MMANSDERETALENSSGRKPRPNYRPPHIARGRGRHDPHIAKAMYNFGVPDLRELLNRKHSETQDRSGDHSGLSRVRSKSTEGRPDFQRTIARSKSTDRQIKNDKPTFIHNPQNIKVEFRTSTGERSCKIDRETTLANIRHVPDHDFADQHQLKSKGGATTNFRGSWRGRNSSHRGRGRQMKENSENNGPNRTENNETAKGRGNIRGRRGNIRRRFQRGSRGRGQNTMSEQKLSGTSEHKITNEDTWDDECVDPVTVEDSNQNFVSNTKEMAAHDEVETNDNTQKESSIVEKETMNENIVVTYPIEEVNAKRSVRFDIPEAEIEEQQRKDLENLKLDDIDDSKTDSENVTVDEKK